MIEREGDRLAALHLRTGSYANGPALAHAVPGNQRPDFPPINKSFELCYACVDADVCPAPAPALAAPHRWRAFGGAPWLARAAPRRCRILHRLRA
jgi:hypothetical protein